MNEHTKYYEVFKACIVGTRRTYENTISRRSEDPPNWKWWSLMNNIGYHFAMNHGGLCIQHISSSTRKSFPDWEKFNSYNCQQLLKIAGKVKIDEENSK